MTEHDLIVNINVPIEPTSIPLRLRHLREEVGLSLNELSTILGLARSYLSRLESGERLNPSLEVLEKLCAFYGLNRDWLIEGTGRMLATLDPKQATERFVKSLAPTVSAGSEEDLRKHKLMAEIRLRLAQVKDTDKDMWAIYRQQIMDALDNYASFCLSQQTQTRSVSSPKTASKRPKSKRA